MIYSVITPLLSFMQRPSKVHGHATLVRVAGTGTGGYMWDRSGRYPSGRILHKT